MKQERTRAVHRRGPTGREKALRAHSQALAKKKAILSGSRAYFSGPMDFVVSRTEEKKHVLFVSPPVLAGSFGELRTHLEKAADQTGLDLLARLEEVAAFKPNPEGIPSMWYMALLKPDDFFDGFGFAEFADCFGWPPGPLDEREQKYPPKRPLLRYLKKLNSEIPERYDHERDQWVENPEWLIFDRSQDAREEP